MMQLYLGTTDAQAEVSGQPVRQGGPGDWCLQPAFLHCSLARSLKVGGIEKDYTPFPARPVLSSLGGWVIRKPSLWSCSGYLR